VNESTLGGQRSGELPAGRDIHEAARVFAVARVGQIHQNFGEIEKMRGSQ